MLQDVSSSISVTQPLTACYPTWPVCMRWASKSAVKPHPFCVWCMCQYYLGVKVHDREETQSIMHSCGYHTLCKAYSLSNHVTNIGINWQKWLSKWLSKYWQSRMLQKRMTVTVTVNLLAVDLVLGRLLRLLVWLLQVMSNITQSRAAVKLVQTQLICIVSCYSDWAFSFWIWA